MARGTLHVGTTGWAYTRPNFNPPGEVTAPPPSWSL